MIDVLKGAGLRARSRAVPGWMALVALVAIPVAMGAARQPPPPARIAVVARALQPGEVVRLDIVSERPLTGVTAQAFGRGAPVPVTRVDARHWRALVGIDLDVKPGTHDVLFDLQDADERRVSQTQPLIVEAKTFPVRKLRVDPRFVQPPKSALPRIERERVRLAAVFAASGVAPRWRGPFIMPVDTAVISNFGTRSIFNGQPRQPHGGADLASPTGTPIHAPNAGRVALAADLYFTGNTVVLDHGAGLFSLLAHLSRLDVREGETIAKGAVVGAVGATGRVTGPHLHWTVRLGAARVDPVSLVFALKDLAD